MKKSPVHHGVNREEVGRLGLAIVGEALANINCDKQNQILKVSLAVAECHGGKEKSLDGTGDLPQN